MGKVGRNEMKKVAAGFLNGAAIAILVSGFLMPVIGSRQLALSYPTSALVSLVIHALALVIARSLED